MQQFKLCIIFAAMLLASASATSISPAPLPDAVTTSPDGKPTPPREFLIFHKKINKRRKREREKETNQNSCPTTPTYPVPHFNSNSTYTRTHSSNNLLTCSSSPPATEDGTPRPRCTAPPDCARWGRRQCKHADKGSGLLVKTYCLEEFCYVICPPVFPSADAPTTTGSTAMT